jgi:hypothetical protein
MKLFTFGLLIFAACSGYAQKCRFSMQDVGETIRLPNAQKVIEPQKYVDSLKQQSRRYVQSLSDGSMVVVEQKNCQIQDISVSILVPKGGNVAESAKVVLLTLFKMPEWKKWFDASHVKILQNEILSTRFKSSIDKPGDFSYGLDNEIIVRSQGTNVSWQLSNREAGSMSLFPSVFSVFVSVGVE